MVVNRICITIYLILMCSDFVLSFALNGMHGLFTSKKIIRNEALYETGCSGGEKCSGEYRTKGCDGSGKILGGLGAVPGLSWVPIKVYRPCPAYLEAGYVYRREGQTLDQVLFSEPSTKMREKMEALRKEQEANQSQEKDPQQQSEREEIIEEKELSPEEKFLNDRFGG